MEKTPVTTRLPPWVPRGYEWIFWGGVALVQAYMIARSKGGVVDGLLAKENLIGFGCILVMIAFWVAIAPGVRAEQDAAKRQLRFRCWWIPRSLRMRALTVVAFGVVAAVFLSEANSVEAVLGGAVVLLALIGVGIWIGSSSNYVELGADALTVNGMRGGGPFMIPTSSAVSYPDISMIHMKKNGSFELHYVEKPTYKKKEMSVEIVPEQRRNFLAELRSRVASGRPETVTVIIDREL